jgi:serine/threonine protein kinase
MLDKEGHIKLIDFNLSKSGFNKLSQRTKSFCGSYAYMPPEILQQKSYGKNIDWYL